MYSFFRSESKNSESVKQINSLFYGTYGITRNNIIIHTLLKYTCIRNNPTIKLRISRDRDIERIKAFKRIISFAFTLFRFIIHFHKPLEIPYHNMVIAFSITVIIISCFNQFEYGMANRCSL